MAMFSIPTKQTSNNSFLYNKISDDDYSRNTISLKNTKSLHLAKMNLPLTVENSMAAPDTQALLPIHSPSPALPFSPSLVGITIQGRTVVPVPGM